jgi:hypothetical protein
MAKKKRIRAVRKTTKRVTRKGKTGRWMKGKAFKVERKNGRLTVLVKR